MKAQAEQAGSEIHLVGWEKEASAAERQDPPLESGPGSLLSLSPHPASRVPLSGMRDCPRNHLYPQFKLDVGMYLSRDVYLGTELWDGNKLEHCLDQSLPRSALSSYPVPVLISYPAAASAICLGVPDLGHFSPQCQGHVGVCSAVL